MLFEYFYWLAKYSTDVIPDLDCTTEGATQTDRVGEQHSDDRVVAETKPNSLPHSRMLHGGHSSTDNIYRSCKDWG